MSDQENGTPESQEPEFSDLLREPPLAAAPPPVTDTEKGPIQSYSLPGSQTQMPSGAEYHYWLYVTQMVSGARR